MYKTSRYGIRQTQEPHYVCEESDAENFSDCKFTEKALFHHFLDKYDNSLRKVSFFRFLQIGASIPGKNGINQRRDVISGIV
jgi:hypothetical protein